MTDAPARPQLHHHLRRMVGRDPHESGRTATPLELFFDLVFVVAFGAAADELAHALAADHVGSGIAAFGFVVFAISWAWINYAWFTSGFDTDDWYFRVATMVQMVGVLVLALGIPDVFASIDTGGPLDNGLLVAGYVIMRLAMVALWARVALHDAAHRRTAVLSIVTVVAAQVGWVIVVVAGVEQPWVWIAIAPLYLLELAGPVLAERSGGRVPWHAHHIAERYGLLVIITLGEVVIGTITSISAIVHEHGWTFDAGLLAVVGTALAFALWWMYFITPSARVLRVRPDRGFVWGTSHIVVFAAVAAVGAGLHVGAYAVEGDASIDNVGVVLTIAVPVAILTTAVFLLYSYVLGAFDAFHVPLFGAALLALAAAVAAAAAGASTAVSLALVLLAPVIVVVGYESVGHRHQAAALERMGAL